MFDGIDAGLGRSPDTGEAVAMGGHFFSSRVDLFHHGGDFPDCHLRGVRHDGMVHLHFWPGVTAGDQQLYKIRAIAELFAGPFDKFHLAVALPGQPPAMTAGDAHEAAAQQEVRARDSLLGRGVSEFKLDPAVAAHVSGKSYAGLEQFRQILHPPQADAGIRFTGYFLITVPGVGFDQKVDMAVNQARYDCFAGAVDNRALGGFRKVGCRSDF